MTDRLTEDGGAAVVVWVDAFTDHAFAGNPAAVCLLRSPVDDGWMQRLAFELGLSETAFVWPEAGALSLRWFTPATEVALCGHATVAAAHALREGARRRTWPGLEVGEELVFRTRGGPVSARFRESLVEIDLPAAAPRPVLAPPAVAAWSPLAAAVGTPTPGADRPDLLVELATADAVRAVAPDLAALRVLPYRSVVVTAPAGGPSGAGAAPDYVLRVFAPAVGVDEDPVTGSAQCLLGPYWGERLGRDRLEAVQLSSRGGRLRVVVDGDRVLVAGGAVTVMAGQLAASGAPPPVRAGTVLRTAPQP